MMNPKVFLIAIVITAGLFFTSCERDDQSNPKPVIELIELGYENSKIGFAGSNLHIEAAIIAEGIIDRVTVEIHPEGEHGKSTSITLHEGKWKVDTTYTKFSGLKNTIFHEHIGIPLNAETGHYHFHFIVTDREGQQTVVEEEIEIQQPDGPDSHGFSASR